MLMGVDKHLMTHHPLLVNVRESEFCSEAEGRAEPGAAPGVAETSASFLLRLCLSPRTKRVFGPPPLLDQEPGLLVSAALGLGSGSLFGFRCHEQGHRHFRSASSP